MENNFKMYNLDHITRTAGNTCPYTFANLVALPFFNPAEIILNHKNVRI